MNKILLDLPSTIFTPRLMLRPPQAGDGAAVSQAFADGYQDLVKWLNLPNIMMSKEQFEIDCRKHQAEWILRGDMRLLIIDKGTNKIMGRTSYPSQLSNWDVPYFGISYFIGEKYRGKGFVTEAVNAMIRYAFKFMHARKIEIKCDVENIKSLAIPERLGMQHEATQRGIWPSQDKKSLSTVKTYSIFEPNDLPILEVRYQ